MDLRDSEDDTETEGVPPPADFLGGDAPRLRIVRLSYVQLTRDVIPVFANVPNVDLDCLFQPPLLGVERVFPRARQLSISSGYVLPDINAYAPTTCFAGLQELSLYTLSDDECTPDLREAIRRCRSVYVNYVDATVFLRPLLGHIDGPVSVSLDQDDNATFVCRLEVTQLPEAPSQYTRTVEFDGYHFLDKFVPQLTPHCNLIVELDVRFKYIDDLVAGLSELPALTTLSIDISDLRHQEVFWSPAYMGFQDVVSILGDDAPIEWSLDDVIPVEGIFSGDPLYRVSCPKLDRLVLQHDRSRPRAFIDTFELMHLARDLSLLRDDRQPSVVLYKDAAQVEFVGPRFLGLGMIFLNDIWEADFSDDDSDA